MAISQRQDIQIELAYLWFPAVYCWPSSLLCPSHHCGRCHHWAVGVWHCQLHRYSKQLCYLLFTRISWILKKPQPTLLRLQYVWYELEAVLTICLIWAQSCPYNTFDMSSKLSLQYVWYELKAVLTFTSCVEAHLYLLLLFPSLMLLSSVFLLLRLPHCVLASYPGRLVNGLNTRCFYPDCSTCT